MRQILLSTQDAEIAVEDREGHGTPVVLLHGLAGSSREMHATADVLAREFRVVLVDQRGHGGSTRRTPDLSRDAFVGDVVAVIEQVAGAPVALVGQSMGAHTAFLTASARPDLVDRLVMLEGHVAGSDNPEEAEQIGKFFGSWPAFFEDIPHARRFLGDSPLAEAWIRDLEPTDAGLAPRFDAEVMQRTIAAVHESRWAEWRTLTVPTLAIFADNGMFTAEQKTELIATRPETQRVDLPDASHDAHLDAFDSWIEALLAFLRPTVA